MSISLLLLTSFVLKLVRRFYIHGVTSDLSTESNEVSCHHAICNA